MSSSNTPSLAETLEVKSGDFQFDDETIRVKGLGARMGDAAVRVSGVLNGLRRGPRKLEAVVDGETGPEVIRWIWEKAPLPLEFLPAAPDRPSAGSRRDRRRRETLTLAGGFAFRNGPRVTVDIFKNGEGTDVRRLTITDGVDFPDASISLSLRKTELEVRFTGHLASATREGLVVTEGRDPVISRAISMRESPASTREDVG